MHIYNQQKSYYKSGQTRPLQHRLAALNYLKDSIKRHEPEVIMALHQDLNKSEFESYMTEIGILYSEIDYTIKHLKKWMIPKKVKTALTHVGTKGKIYPDLRGHIDYRSVELSIPTRDGATHWGDCWGEYSNC